MAALQVSIQGPEDVVIGEETEYVIEWKNASFQAVQDVEIRLGIPPVLQVTYMDPWPIDRDTMSWKLGLVAPGAEGKVTLRGIPFGRIGDTTALQAVLTAPDQGATDIKDALSTKSIAMKSSIIEGNWSVPPRIVAGDEIEIALDLKNTGKTDLEKLDIAIRYPEAFVPQASSTSANTSTHTFLASIPRFGAEATTTIRFQGAFAAGVSGEQSFYADIKQQYEKAAIAIYSASTSAPVLASDLSIQVIANGSNTGRSISPGDPVRVTVAYSNTSADTLSDVSLLLAFESLRDGKSATGTSFLSWSTLDDTNKGVTSTKTRIQTLLYDKKSIPALASLKPGDRGTIDITLPTLAVTKPTNDAVIRIVSTGKVGRVGEQEVQRSISTQPLSLRYRSDAVFVGTARYFTEEGAPIGSGPLPPVVGEPTTYRVYWAIEKSLHELDAVTVTTTLPESVVFGGSKEIGAGSLVFTTSTRELRWSLNKLPEDVSLAEVSFDLVLTPNPLDSGRFAPLTTGMLFTAKDSLLNEAITQNSTALSTDLLDDDGAKGKGVVKK